MELARFIPDTPIVLVVPPLAHLSWPALGVHAVASMARSRGHDVGIAYLNLAFGGRIGVVEYSNLSNAPADWLLGERLFAHAAFGLDALDLPGFEETVRSHNAQSPGRAQRYLDHLSDATGHAWDEWGTRYDSDQLARFSAAATQLVDDAAPLLAGRAVVGVTSSFDQTNAAIALLQRIKALSPEVTTVIGGANCDGVMAEAVADLAGAAADHLFQGESDHAFSAFLDARTSPTGQERIIKGSPVVDMDALPPPDLADYFAALSWVPEMENVPVWAAYETSRGCWWGEKRHCTFCGLNGTGMGFRSRSPNRALDDLKALTQAHPTRFVCMTDNIMPYGYHRTFVPRLAIEVPDLHVFYEQKANLTLAQVRGLYDAGIKVIQPGIESLATPVLDRMRKGVLARQNLALLRYCRSTSMTVKWNLLYGFPGEQRAPYAEMHALLPLITHLPPPHVLTHLSIDRFSPYFDAPEEHGIRDLKPLPAYNDVFPQSAQQQRLAYHFVGNWDAESLDDPGLMTALWNQIRHWRDQWSDDNVPTLQLNPAGPGQWVLIDSRFGAAQTLWLSDVQAAAVTVGGPLERVVAAKWAIRSRFSVEMDGWCVPLAVARPDVLSELERRFRLDEAFEEWVTVLGR